MGLTAESLSHLATGYWASGTLCAAIQLKIFETLTPGPATAGDVALATGAKAELLPALLDAMVSLGLLAPTPAGYKIPEASRPLLAADSPTNMLAALAYNVELFSQWQVLSAVIATGKPARSRQQVDRVAETRRFVLGMESKARAFAPALLPLIDVDGVRRLLDVGAGPGTLSRMLAERNPGLEEVVLLDLPMVLHVTEEFTETSSAADRLKLHMADYHQEDFPADFDLVLHAGALHQDTGAAACAVMAKCFAALRPGGQVIVIDLMLDGTRSQPQFSALFQLNMFLSQPTARVFSEAEVTGLLERVGFASPVVRRAPESPYVVVTARRPS